MRRTSSNTMRKKEVLVDGGLLPAVTCLDAGVPSAARSIDELIVLADECDLEALGRRISPMVLSRDDSDDVRGDMSEVL